MMKMDCEKKYFACSEHVDRVLFGLGLPNYAPQVSQEFGITEEEADNLLAGREVEYNTIEAVYTRASECGVKNYLPCKHFTK